MSCTPPKKSHPWHRGFKDKKRRKTPPATAHPAKRRVFVALEIETDAPLSALKDRESWEGFVVGRVLQVQVNVARSEE